MNKNIDELKLEEATRAEIEEFEGNLEKFSPLAQAKKNYKKGRILTLEEYAEEAPSMSKFKKR